MNKESIKMTRYELDLTQQEFADRLGVSLHTVRKWEQGTYIPVGRNMHKLKKLSDSV